ILRSPFAAPATAGLTEAATSVFKCGSRCPIDEQRCSDLLANEAGHRQRVKDLVEAEPAWARVRPLESVDESAGRVARTTHGDEREHRSTRAVDQLRDEEAGSPAEP